MHTPDASKNFAPKKAPETPPAKTAAPAFEIKEAWLVARIGASRDTLRALRKRHLVEGEDWKQDGRSVRLTEAAVEKLRAVFKLTPDEAPRAPLALLTFPGCPGHEQIVTLKAWRFYPDLKNERILIAYRPGTDPKNPRNQVRVRVSSSKNFVRHMELPARLYQPPDLYELTRPAPRARGRW